MITWLSSSDGGRGGWYFASLLPCVFQTINFYTRRASAISTTAPSRYSILTLLDPDVGLLEDRAPFGGLRVHECLEVLWRTSHRHGARLVKRRQNRGILEDTQKIGVDFRHQFRRHARWSEKSPPHRSLVARHTGFRHRRHIRQRLRSDRGGHCNHANQAAVALPNDFRHWIDAHGYISGQHRLACRP